MKSVVGKLLRGRYLITQELGQEDFYASYLAEDKNSSTNSICEVQRLYPQQGNQILSLRTWQNLQKRFLAEAAILEKLGKHPQIPQLQTYFIDGREFFLIKELIPGQTLAEITADKSLSEEQGVIWLQDILNILDFAHRMGVMHLKINPHNLIQEQEQKNLFLTNFATIENLILTINRQQQIYPQEIIKNQTYIAPEQHRGEASFNTDIYGLGKTIIYSFTQQVPDWNHIESTVYFDRYLKHISPKLVKILQKMICKNQQSRYQSVVEVLHDLDREENVVVLPSPFDFESPVAEIKTNSAKSTPIRFDKILLWSLLILPFVTSIFILFLGIQRNISRRLVSYTNTAYNFSIKYPQEWSLKELDDPITGEVVVFTSPYENEFDIYQEKVYISVSYLSPKLDNLDQYTQNLLAQISSQESKTIQIHQQKKIQLDEQPAHILVYSRTEEQLLVKQMEMFTINNNRIYTVIYTAEMNKYQKFLGIARKMIDSLEIYSGS